MTAFDHLTVVRTPRAIRSCVLLLIMVLVGACSSDSGDTGRFAVEQQRPAETMTTPQPQSSPSSQDSPSPQESPTESATSAMDNVMKQAGSGALDSRALGKLYLQMTEEERFDFIEQRVRHVSRMIGSGTYEFSRQSLGYIKQ